MEWGGAWCYAPVQGVEWGGGSPAAWRYAPVQGCLKLEASCAIKDSDLVGTALFQNPDPAGPQGDLPRIHAALGLDRSLDLFVVNEWLLLSPPRPIPRASASLTDAQDILSHPTTAGGRARRLLPCSLELSCWKRH